MDGRVTIGTTYDVKPFYDKAMQYTRELADTCNTPSGFIDFILNKNALDISLDTGHYVVAKGYYGNLIGSGKNTYSYKPCRCNG
jgi:hypothetical protein